MSAARQWRIEEPGFPVTGSSREKLEFAVKYAAIAPPERSWQPWGLRVSNQSVEMFANRPPASSGLDPEGRETLISCGSALEFLQVALKHFGCLGRIERFPSLDQPALVARIHAGHRRSQNGDNDALFAAMNSVAHPSKPERARPSSAPVFDEIQSEADVGSGWLEFAQSETTRRKLERLADTASANKVGELKSRSGGLLETVARRAGLGFGSSAVSGSYVALARWTRPVLNLRINILPLFAGGPLEAGPARGYPVKLAVLKTKTDDRRGWLAAGRTLARSILCARAKAVTCVFFTGALKDPLHRSELRTSIGHKGFAQVIVRFQMEPLESDRRSHIGEFPTSRMNFPQNVETRTR